MNHKSVKGNKRLYALSMVHPFFQWQDQKNQTGWGKDTKLKVLE